MLCFLYFRKFIMMADDSEIIINYKRGDDRDIPEDVVPTHSHTNSGRQPGNRFIVGNDGESDRQATMPEANNNSSDARGGVTRREQQTILRPRQPTQRIITNYPRVEQDSDSDYDDASQEDHHNTGY
jgi:hypothetical protein